MTDINENKAFVTAEYLKKIAQDAKHIKTRCYELMQIQANSQVLDVGCGPATDTIALAQYIGQGGRIVGIDNDPAMIEKANLEVKQHQITKSIQHIEGNVQELPFSNCEFDIVHAERLLQVLPESIKPQQIFAEMNRVLKANGRIVIADADWGTASVSFSDNRLERRLLNFFALKLRPNGFAGRQLYELVKSNGYGDVTVEVFPFVVWDFSETPFGEWLTGESLKSGVATDVELELWTKELTQKSAARTFFSCVNMVIVAGTKPTAHDTEFQNP